MHRLTSSLSIHVAWYPPGASVPEHVNGPHVTSGGWYYFDDISMAHGPHFTDGDAVKAMQKAGCHPREPKTPTTESELFEQFRKIANEQPPIDPLAMHNEASFDVELPASVIPGPIEICPLDNVGTGIPGDTGDDEVGQFGIGLLHDIKRLHEPNSYQRGTISPIPQLSPENLAIIDSLKPAVEFLDRAELGTIDSVEIVDVNKGHVALVCQGGSIEVRRGNWALSLSEPEDRVRVTNVWFMNKWLINLPVIAPDNEPGLIAREKFYAAFNTAFEGTALTYKEFQYVADFLSVALVSVMTPELRDELVKDEMGQEILRLMAQRAEQVPAAIEALGISTLLKAKCTNCEGRGVIKMLGTPCCCCGGKGYASVVSLEYQGRRLELWDPSMHNTVLVPLGQPVANIEFRKMTQEEVDEMTKRKPPQAVGHTAGLVNADFQ